MTVDDKALRNHAEFIWSVADLLRGDYKQSEYGKVILPFVVLRRFDCVLDKTKARVVERAKALEGRLDNVDPVLRQTAGEQFFNTSELTLPRLLDDPSNIADHLHAYVRAFSDVARDVLDKFDLHTQIDRLDRADLLYVVTSRFCEIDLHPDQVSHLEMGYLYEELIRRFSELSNETAGEHFTPREVIRLMVDLLFDPDDDTLSKPGVIRTLADPACGTGGMLSVAQDRMRDYNDSGQLEVYGQELNGETYAICRSDLMLKGQDADNIVHGNSFTEDGLAGHSFDYMLSNPPFGVSWRKVQKKIKDEHDDMGFAGRFGAGLPRVSDGSLLFLQHMISKMKTEDPGSRLAIVFNGSPLFTGGAGSGESEIRRWIIENDWLEAIIALPDQLFYNTGIATYIWVLDNRKVPERKGKIQLINAVDFFEKMSKSLGNKRNEITPAQIREITEIYGDFEEGKYCKIFDNADLGYHRIVVEQRPKDEEGEIVNDSQVQHRPDTSIRDYENVLLTEDVEEYFRREVEPHVASGWIDHSKARVGYEINFTRYFYEYTPLRSTAEIRADLVRLTEEMSGITLKAIDA